MVTRINPGVAGTWAIAEERAEYSTQYDCNTDESRLQSILEQSNKKRAERTGYCKVDWRLVRAGWMTTSELAVYVVLCSHVHGKSGRLDPGVRTMARELGCSPTTVVKALAGLEAKKVVTVLKRRNRSSVYGLNDLRHKEDD